MIICVSFDFLSEILHWTSFSSNLIRIINVSAFSHWSIHGPSRPVRFIEPLNTRKLVRSFKIWLNYSNSLKYLDFYEFVLLNQFLVWSKSRTSIFILSIGTRGSQRVFLIVKISSGTLPKGFPKFNFLYFLFFCFLLIF